MKGSGKNDQENDDCIQVSVRVRPTLKNEMEEKIGWEWKDNTLTFRNCLQSAYSFDHLFPPESSNSDIFASVVQKIVYKSMQGFHGTVFTYGQTSSGKTFTMSGSQSQPGVIPLSIHYCFESIHKRFTDREFLIRVAYLEVYNEQVKDLLNTELSQIKIQHDVKLGTVLTGVKEQVVLNAQQVIALLKAGEAHRHVGNTDMNEKSSRAHTILKLTIESKARIDSADGPIRVSVLNLVDLAGSENAKMTGSTGERAREAKHINQSLLTLSLILQRLSTVKNGSSHIQYLPFRDSKLTRLLQSSLSGNAQITIICTISPTLRCAEESLNTLKFAARAKSIRTRADVNEVMDDKTLLRMYRTEIHSLKTRLAVVETQGIELLLSDAIIERKSNEFSTDCSDVNTQSSVSDIQSVTVRDEEWNIGDNYDDDESTKILQVASMSSKLTLRPL